MQITEAGIRLRPWVVRYLWPDQLDAIAAAAGLDLEHRWSDWRRSPFDDTSPVHVSVYRRAAVSQLRLNPLNGRWVTIATERATRPADFAPRRLPVETGPSRPCPFCPGNEEATPPALETYGRDGSWLVRVVPNLYPAFSGAGEMEVTRIGPVFVQAPANGIHEVLVLTPKHDIGWADLDDKDAGLVMAAIRDRLEDHGRDSERPLHPDDREPRPRGGGVARAPARPAARHPLRARRAARRARRLPPVRRGRRHRLGADLEPDRTDECLLCRMVDDRA